MDLVIDYETMARISQSCDTALETLEKTVRDISLADDWQALTVLMVLEHIHRRLDEAARASTLLRRTLAPDLTYFRANRLGHIAHGDWPGGEKLPEGLRPLIF